MPIKLSNLTQAFSQVGQEKTKSRLSPQTNEERTVPVERPQSAAEVALGRPSSEALQSEALQETRFSSAEEAEGATGAVADRIARDAGVAVQAGAGRLSKAAAALLS